MVTKVEVFLNDTNGGSFAPGTHEHSDRRRAATRALGRHPDHLPFCDGYRHGDVLVKSVLEYLGADDDYMALAWHAVAAANADDRPNGRFERSFSTGDVLRVRKSDGSVVWLAGTGFDLVEVAEEPTTVYDLDGEREW